MKYYEFPYTGNCILLAVKEENYNNFKPMKLYMNLIGGYENLYDMRTNGAYPKEVPRDEALLKFILSKGNENRLVRDVVGVFNNSYDCVLIADSSLV